MIFVLKFKYEEEVSRVVRFEGSVKIKVQKKCRVEKSLKKMKHSFNFGKSKRAYGMYLVPCIRTEMLKKKASKGLAKKQE